MCCKILYHFTGDKRTNQLVKWWCTNTAFWFAAFVPSTCFHTGNLRFLNQPLWKSLWINQVLKGWVFKHSGTQICSRYEQMQWNTRLVGKTCFPRKIFSMGKPPTSTTNSIPIEGSNTISMNKHDKHLKNPQPNLGILEVGKKIAISCANWPVGWFSILTNGPVGLVRGDPWLAHRKMDLKGKLFQWHHHFFGCQYFGCQKFTSIFCCCQYFVKNTCSMQKGFFCVS